jgi:hypothetical protein
MEMIIEGFKKLPVCRQLGEGTSGIHLEWVETVDNRYCYWFNPIDVLHVWTKDEDWIYWVRQEAWGMALIIY